MSTVIENRTWRYATKKFDSSKKISEEDLETLLEATRLSASSYGLQPYHVIVVSDQEVKVPAGWLIEKAGFKGKRFNDYGVHNKQALVLVNYGNASGKDIFELAKLIQKTVNRVFNIAIETEVNII